jgi:hypothetical protein
MVTIQHIYVIMYYYKGKVIQVMQVMSSDSDKLESNIVVL